MISVLINVGNFIINPITSWVLNNLHIQIYCINYLWNNR